MKREATDKQPPNPYEAPTCHLLANLERSGCQFFRNGEWYGAGEVAQEASVDGDLARTLGALSRITQQCVACHAAFRVQ
jgi:cytochrome c556